MLIAQNQDASSFGVCCGVTHWFTGAMVTRLCPCVAEEGRDVKETLPYLFWVFSESQSAVLAGLELVKILLSGSPKC